jgi:pre-mRNA-splicing factor SYF1
MEKVTRVGYKSVNELADVWIDYAEMEIRADNMDKALDIMALATKSPCVSNVDYFDEVRRLNPQLFLTIDPHSPCPRPQIQ